MADKPEKKKQTTTAKAGESKVIKRVVKNPETFRERAIKASEGDDKPTRRTRIKSSAKRVTTPVFSPVASSSRRVASLPPFKYLRKPLRIIGRILLPRYIRNSWIELRRVKWPNWHESRQLTFAVILFATVFGIIIAIVDYGLDKLFRNVLLK